MRNDILGHTAHTHTHGKEKELWKLLQLPLQTFFKQQFGILGTTGNCLLTEDQMMCLINIMLVTGDL